MLDKELTETIKVWPIASKVISTLHTEEQYNKAVKRLDQLIDEVSEREDPLIESLIDTLGTLIKDYENRNIPEPEGNPIECLKYLMEEHNLKQTKVETANGETIRFVYDESVDMLDVFFGENEPATGVELTDHILLRLNKTTGRAVSLTLLHFSILTEQTEYGPRSYPLDKLEELPENLRELVVRVLTTMPVNQFLKRCHFQESPTKRMPFTYVDRSGFGMSYTRRHLWPDSLESEYTKPRR